MATPAAAAATPASSSTTMRIQPADVSSASSSTPVVAENLERGTLTLSAVRAGRLQGTDTDMGRSHVRLYIKGEGDEEWTARTRTGGGVNPVYTKDNQALVLTNVPFPPREVKMEVIEERRDVLLGTVWLMPEQIVSFSTAGPSGAMKIHSTRYDRQGKLDFEMKWDKNPLPLREPWIAMATAVEQTQRYTSYLDSTFDRAIDGLVHFRHVLSEWFGSLNFTQICATLALLFLTLCVLSLSVWFPILLFFPVITTLFLITSLLVVACGPFILVVVWVVLAARPVQCRVMRHVYSWVLSIDLLRPLFLKPPSSSPSAP